MDEERARPGAGPPGTDRGSAVVEYVMVAGLVAMIFAATLQLALALHVRNTLIDAAAAGARYGTLADRSPEDGVERTRRIVSGALGPRYAQDVVATTAAVGELRTEMNAHFDELNKRFDRLEASAAQVSRAR